MLSLSSITLFILASSVFPRFISLIYVLLDKLPLQSFNLKKQLFSSPISTYNCFSNFLVVYVNRLFRAIICLLQSDVIVLFRGRPCCSVHYRYMVYVLLAIVSFLLPCLTDLISFSNFVRNWFLTLQNLITFSILTKSFLNQDQQFTHCTKNEAFHQGFLE